jgi:hypothetical protein
MFQSLIHDHLQGSSFVLSAFTTFQLPASSFVFFGYAAVCHLFVCVSGVALCVLSSRELHVVVCLLFVCVSGVALWTHIQIEGIRPHTKKRQMTKQTAER